MTVFTNLDFEKKIGKSLLEQFRFWNTETLLNQAADLCDQCLKDVKEFQQIETFEFIQLQELDLKEKEIKNEEKKKQFERDATLANDEFDDINNRLFYLTEAKGHAEIGYNKSEADDKSSLAQNSNEAYARYIGATKEKEIAERKKNWSSLDKSDDEELLSLKRTQLDDKKSKTKDDKVFDFKHQKEQCQKRLDRNFNDLLERIFVIEIGIENVYGISQTITEEIKATNDHFSKITLAYNWAYDRIADLRKYFQLDQSFTVIISLKEIFTTKKFQMLINSKNEFITNFVLSKKIFPTETHDNIRFKGISSSFIGNVAKNPWKMQIKPPIKGLYIREGNEIEIDQTQIPSCILGRVENVNSNRSPEICGMVSLINCSPISFDDMPWNLKIFKPDVLSEMFSNLEDVLIELNLTGKLL